VADMQDRRPGSTHPDDATLFDLAEGALAPGHAGDVARHLDRCAACAAFVETAAAGRAAARDQQLEQLPAPAVDRLAAAFDDAWHEHAPARAPLATEPLQVDGARPAAPSRWQGVRRRAVPVLAFAVLAGLAGVSVTVLEPSSGGLPGEPSEETAASADDHGARFMSTDPDPAAGQGTTSGGAPAPRADTDVQAERFDAPAAGSLDEDGYLADDVHAGPEAVTIPADPATGESELAVPRCTARFDGLQPLLPDGSLPSWIAHGPGGLVVACG
jgi:hypothetical protein